MRPASLDILPGKLGGGHHSSKYSPCALCECLDKYKSQLINSQDRCSGLDPLLLLRVIEGVEEQEAQSDPSTRQIFKGLRFLHPEAEEVESKYSCVSSY